MFGGHSRAENNCRETTVSVRSAAGETYELDVRAYDDGVALRSRLAAKAGRKINGESTEWKMAGMDCFTLPDFFRSAFVQAMVPA